MWKGELHAKTKHHMHGEEVMQNGPHLISYICMQEKERKFIRVNTIAAVAPENWRRARLSVREGIQLEWLLDCIFPVYVTSNMCVPIGTIYNEIGHAPERCANSTQNILCLSFNIVSE